jgi:glyoxylase-like metal-dependent hydrolase (beta-lactamase superfamily II)
LPRSFQSSASPRRGLLKDREYVPVLPEVKARALPVDPKKGYLVKEVKPGVFVILFDASPTFAQHIQEAVAQITQEPIRQIVYSHTHLDRIAGTELLLKKIPDLESSLNAASLIFSWRRTNDGGQSLRRRSPAN